MRWIVPLLLAVAPAQALTAHPGHDGSSYILLSGKDGSTTFNGQYDDYRRAQALRSGDAPLLYVRRDGVAYVIRDRAVLAQAEAIMQPQRVLGARQEELGRQQAALGRQQANLGATQAQLGRVMANARVRQMNELGNRMGELGRGQAALGERQAELGRRQGELGREQARLAKLAQPKLDALVADALRRGLAQKVD